eukprot:1979999-Pyramimonas_sp.AAC.1
MDLCEDEVEETLNLLANDRSWKQNKDLKRAARKGREYFRGKSGGDRAAPPPPRPPPRPGLRAGGRGGAKGRGRGRGSGGRGR